jgi:hypothetical protein
MRTGQNRKLNEGDRHSVAFAHCPHLHLPAAPAGRKTAGFAFNCTSPLGILLVRAGYQLQSSVARRALRLAQQAKTPQDIFRAQALMRRVIIKLECHLRQLMRHLQTPQRPTVRKPIPLRPLFVQHNPQRRAPPSKRKAKAEGAEGDAESHSDLWFASVVPLLARAPTFTTFVAADG